MDKIEPPTFNADGSMNVTPEWLRAAATYLEFWNQHERTTGGRVVQRSPHGNSNNA